MTKRRVYDDEGNPQFVTFSCYKRRKLLDPDICKRIVIGVMNMELVRRKGVCSAFVIMPNHVHAIFWFPVPRQLSGFMDKWKELSSRKIAAAYQKHFPEYWSSAGEETAVWQARYYGFNLFSDRKFNEKVEYIHNNPVRAGLVKVQSDWKWSSARFYQLGEQVGVPLSWPP